MSLNLLRPPEPRNEERFGAEYPVKPLKIDGAGVSYKHELPPHHAPTIVHGDFTRANTADARRAQLAILEGGPAAGREFEVPRNMKTLAIPALRTDAAPAVAGKIERTFGVDERGRELKVTQTVVNGDMAPANYRRSKRFNDEGLPIFEFVG
jgi:hypothetical protein